MAALGLRMVWRTGIVSLRDAPDLCETLGVPTMAYRVFAFATACFLAGVTGGVYGSFNTFLHSLRFPKRIRFIEKGKIIAGSNERLWSLPLPDPDDKAPGFAQTKRERNKVGVARNQAVSVDPGVAEHVDCSDHEFDVRGVLACRGLGTTH